MNQPARRTRRAFWLYGDKEARWRIIVAKDLNGTWTWYYKRPDETLFIYLGPIQKILTTELAQQIRTTELVSDLY